MIVADTNLIAYILIPGPFSEDARRVLEQDSEWVAPSLWRSEIRNVLSLYMKHQEMPLGDALVLMDQAEAILQGAGYDVPSTKVLRLARASPCTSYDCEFAALALDLGVPLVTSDKALLKAFPEFACSPRDFVSQ